MTLEEKLLELIEAETICTDQTCKQNGYSAIAAKNVAELICEEVSSAFDAGYDYRSSLLPEIIDEFGENSMPNKEQYLNHLQTKEESQ